MQILTELSRYFKQMPGVGGKSAQRLAFFILAQPRSWVDAFCQSLQQVKEKVKYCSHCFNVTLVDPCPICAASDRERSIVCVVANPQDQIVIERTGKYCGLYHILGGLISPLDGITPELLKIKELSDRVKKENLREVFFAINPTVEGEATIIYISKLLRPLNIKMTRLAYGLPIGGDIDYADELTILKAYEGRIEI
jgi:recombination protein RecR